MDAVTLLPDEDQNWDPGGEVLRVTMASVAAAIQRQAKDSSDEQSRTELDSHANMPVVGRHAYILAETGKSVDVSPFTPDYKPLVAKLVDAAVLYENPYDGKEYILVIQNAIHVPSMMNNLVPPFMLREAGISVNDVPKIHVEDPSEDDHAITFRESGFRIPLALWGTFSYFPTSKPTTEMLQEPPDVFVLTPTHWDPHSDANAFNEESMLDWEGNMRQKKDRSYRVVIDDLPEDEAMVSALQIGSAEQEAIDKTFPLEDSEELIGEGGKPRSMATLYDLLREQADVSAFKMRIGSMNATLDVYVETVTDEESATLK